jgi:chromosome segregation ATPase
MSEREQLASLLDRLFSEGGGGVSRADVEKLFGAMRREKAALAGRLDGAQAELAACRSEVAKLTDQLRQAQVHAGQLDNQLGLARFRVTQLEDEVGDLQRTITVSAEESARMLKAGLVERLPDCGGPFHELRLTPKGEKRLNDSLTEAERRKELGLP